MKYERCRKAELVKFTEDRHLNITASNLTKGPRVRDYVRVLKQADKHVTFRFFGLPPELRTRIYEDVLTLQNSFTSFPQILSTCRQANTEGTNILYGNNLIQIRLHGDGVFVHGKHCGGYSYRGSRQYTNYHQLRWPRLLRKAQFLRVSVASGTWQSYNLPMSSWARLPSISNVIYSLSVFLNRSQRLRHIEVDFEGISAPIQSVPGWQTALATACYPLKLVAPSCQCRILNSSVQGLDTLDFTPLHMPSHQYDTTAAKWNLFQACGNAAWDLAQQLGLVNSLLSTLDAITGLVHALASLLGRLEADDGNAVSRWIPDFIAIVNWVRMVMEVSSAHFGNTGVWRDLEKLLRCEIDVRMAYGYSKVSWTWIM